MLVGLFLGLALIKFGNPVILDHLLTQSAADLAAANSSLALPTAPDLAQGGDWMESLYQPWSFTRGLWLLGVLGVLAFKDAVWKKHPPAWLWAPIIFWFFWQILAGFQTVNVNLTKNTLWQFTACLVCLFVGWHGLPQNRSIRFLWYGVATGMLLVLWRGFTQHHGGLEALRTFIYEQPNWKELSPDLVKRAVGGRIFGTLVYPNALAGVILLLLPPTAVALFELTRRLPNIYRGVAIGVFGYLGIACLLWTGSKSGWLIALGMLVAMLLRLKLQARWRGLLVAALCVAGLAGFFIRYSKYFQRGATSVTARFDYWKAAWTTAKTHPWLGTGPGTFMISYKQLKAPESEMARLTHNDYLEQASDSGFPGFVGFTGFIVSVVIYLYRKRIVSSDAHRSATALGLAAILVQSLLEFGLYIPAIAWPTFVLLGWMLGADPSPGTKLPDRAVV